MKDKSAAYQFKIEYDFIFYFLYFTYGHLIKPILGKTLIVETRVKRKLSKYLQ